MTDQTQADRVIAVFGGRAEMARSTRFTYNQIRRWHEAGFVPSPDHQDIIDDAAASGYEVPPHIFIAHLTAKPAMRSSKSGV